MGSRSSGLTTLVVGIDAACLPVLRPLFDAGAIPTLQELFESGVSGELESQIPPWTASAWPSLYTGVNPGKHGVFGFLRFDGYDWDVVNQSHVRQPAVWELLDHHGLSSVVVNVPVTAPARPIDGAIVPGYVAPESPTCYPDGLLDDIEREVGEYRVYAPRGVTGDEQVEWYRRLTRLRGETFRYLAERFDPDFGFVQFQQSDTVFHERPGDMDAVRAVYEAIDAEVASIIEQCAPANVIVVSDHGMGPYDGYEFRLNEFLADHGYVTPTMGGRGMPNWVDTRENELQAGEAAHGRGPTLLERGVATAARFGLTTQRVEPVLDTLGVKGVVARYVPTAATRAGEEQVDFEQSRAYLRDSIELGVRINLEGREPNGTVPEREYETVRDDLIELLSGVETPNGDPVFERVARREAYFEGPVADDAVDVVAVPAGFDVALSTKLGKDWFAPPEEPWNHKLQGCIAAYGDRVDGTVVLDHAHIFDVAPTVLATFGLPSDARMDGTALPFVAHAGRQSYPVSVTGGVERTEDPAVAQRLSDLGYLE